MPVTRDDGTVVLALVRGDDRLEEAKLAAALGAATRPATVEEIRAAFGADPGSLGPVGFAGEVIADDTLRERPVRRGCEPDRLAPARGRGGSRLPGALRGHQGAAGRRPLPELRRRPELSDRDRGRPHLQARHHVLGAARRDLPRRGRPGARARRWARTASAPAAYSPPPSSSAMTSWGFVWPPKIAPYDVHVVVLTGADEIGLQAAEALSAGGRRRPARRPRAQAGREVRGRRSDRCPAAGDCGQEEPGGRCGRCEGTLDRGRATCAGVRAGDRRLNMAKRRKYSAEAFGAAVERLMNETGVTYRALAAKTGLSAGYLNHLVHENRPVPSNDVVRDPREVARRRARALPRVPAPRDHRATRGDARSRRPALQAAERLGQLATNTRRVSASYQTAGGAPSRDHWGVMGLHRLHSAGGLRASGGFVRHAAARACGAGM